jgi:hypothetical protein
VAPSLGTKRASTRSRNDLAQGPLPIAAFRIPAVQSLSSFTRFRTRTGARLGTFCLAVLLVDDGPTDRLNAGSKSVNKIADLSFCFMASPREKHVGKYGCVCFL